MDDHDMVKQWKNQMIDLIHVIYNMRNELN